MPVFLRRACICIASVVAGGVALVAVGRGATAEQRDGNGLIIPCVCALAGRLVPLGREACLQTPEGLRMARCTLAGNVTSWQPTDAPCPTSRTSPYRTADRKMPHTERIVP